MRSRILPRDEYIRLAENDKELLVLISGLPADDVRVHVVEDGDELVGVWSILKMLHLEGARIKPGHKTAAIRLFRSVREDLQASGEPWVLTGATDPQVKDIILRMGGQPVKVDTYMLSLRERRVA